MAFTKLYLTTNAAPFTPSNLRGAWDDSAAAVTRALEPSKLGGGAIVGVNRIESSSDTAFDVLLYRGVSGPVSAQTISGNLDIVIACNASNDAEFVWHVHVYVTEGDTDTVRGTLINDYIDSVDWWAQPRSFALASAQAMSSVSASAGDRIVVELGYQAQNAFGAPTHFYDGAMYYGTQRPLDNAPAEDMTAGFNFIQEQFAAFISFSNSISEEPLDVRVTQFAAEWPNKGGSEARVTQFAPEIANSGTREIRATQFLAEWVTTQDDTHINVFAAF